MQFYVLTGHTCGCRRSLSIWGRDRGAQGGQGVGMFQQGQRDELSGGSDADRVRLRRRLSPPEAPDVALLDRRDEGVLERRDVVLARERRRL